MLLDKTNIFVFGKFSSMTSPSSLLGFSVSSFVALNADGDIDQDASVSNFLQAAEAAVQEQNENRNSVLAILEKFSSEYVTTDDVIGRCISQYERKNDLDLSPSDRKVRAESLSGTVESLKTSGYLYAKIGKGGGLQTSENHLRIVEAVEAKKNAKKLAGEESGGSKELPLSFISRQANSTNHAKPFSKAFGTDVAGEISA